MMFVVFICFVVDAVSIANKEYVVSRTIQFVARRLAIQGGVSNTIPINFATSGTNNYLTTTELIDYVDEQMKKAMIEPNEWSIKITGRKIIPRTNGASYIDNQSIILSASNRNKEILIDYLDGIDVEFSYTYKWNLFSQVISIADNSNIHTFKQHSISEFKYNYDWWEGEHEDNESYEQYEIVETH